MIRVCLGSRTWTCDSVSFVWGKSKVGELAVPSSPLLLAWYPLTRNLAGACVGSRELLRLESWGGTAQDVTSLTLFLLLLLGFLWC